MVVHPCLANCMSKILKTSLRFALSLVFPVQDEITKFMVSKICISIVNIRLKYHLLMNLQGQMEVLPNFMHMQGKKCTLLYFRSIWFWSLRGTTVSWRKSGQSACVIWLIAAPTRCDLRLTKLRFALSGRMETFHSSKWYWAIYDC